MLTSPVIAWDELPLAFRKGIAEGHAVWPDKISHLYWLKKKTPAIFGQCYNMHLDVRYSK